MRSSSCTRRTRSKKNQTPPRGFDETAQGASQALVQGRSASCAEPVARESTGVRKGTGVHEGTGECGNAFAHGTETLHGGAKLESVPDDAGSLSGISGLRDFLQPGEQKTKGWTGSRDLPSQNGFPVREQSECRARKQGSAQQVPSKTFEDTTASELLKRLQKRDAEEDTPWFAGRSYYASLIPLLETSRARWFSKKVEKTEGETFGSLVSDSAPAVEPGSPESTTTTMLSDVANESELDHIQDSSDARLRRAKAAMEASRREAILARKILVEESASKDTAAHLRRAFNALQGLTQECELQVDVPEMVIVGMQSDGKSSFLEALLGFQFNVVDSNIGTRRPLVLQMLCDPARSEPRCRFKKETGPVRALARTETSTAEPVPKRRRVEGEPSSGGDDALFEEPVPPEAICDQILQRTNALVGADGSRVSDLPIVLRVEYQRCANLTVWDMPGFRVGGDAQLRAAIESMAMNAIRPPHRVVLCLEQSTVEWANTQSRPLVQRVDEAFERTVLVNTKFDNRVKELRTAAQASTYLRGENLPPHAKPFFISLPLLRDLNPREFCDEIVECAAQDHRRLRELGVDDEAQLARVGFHRLRRHLEQLLATRLHAAAQPASVALGLRIGQLSQELDRLNACTGGQQRVLDAAPQLAREFCHRALKSLKELIDGSNRLDASEHGLSLSEEKRAAQKRLCDDCAVDARSLQTHPLLDPACDVAALGTLRLYGGAQFARLEAEVGEAVRACRLPVLSSDELASSLGLDALSAHPFAANAAAREIVLQKSRAALLPLLEAALMRAVFICHHSFDLALRMVALDAADFAASPASRIAGPSAALLHCGVLMEYPAFVAQAQRTHADFVRARFLNAYEALQNDLEALARGLPDAVVLPSGATRSSREASLAEAPDQADTQTPDEVARAAVAEASQQHFSALCGLFASCVRSKTLALFLRPLKNELGVAFSEWLGACGEADYGHLLNRDGSEVTERRRRAEEQLASLRAQFAVFQTHLQSLEAASSNKHGGPTQQQTSQTSAHAARQ